MKYWLAANNPVLIVVYHPERDLLYAVHVQGYALAHAEIARTGVFKFDKAETTLLAEHAHKLRSIVFSDGGAARLLTARMVRPVNTRDSQVLAMPQRSSAE